MNFFNFFNLFLQILFFNIIYPVYTIKTKPLIYETTFCEGEIAIISCAESDTVISMQLANYGRFSLGVCNPTADISLDTNCYNNETLQILKNICEGKNECDISVDDTVFGNHCPKTSKYLEIQYMCVTAASSTITPTVSSTLCKCTIEENYPNNQTCGTRKFENDDIIFFSILLLIACFGSAFLGAMILYLYFKKYYNIVQRDDAIQHHRNQENKKMFLQINKNFDSKRKGSINEYDEIL